MNLKYKVIGAIAGLLLSASIISSIVNYKMDVESTQTQLKNISLPLSIDNIYTEIQQRMIEPLIVSSLMSNDTFMKDWLISGEKDVPNISKYLKEIQDKYKLFTSFLVSDNTKNYYHPKGIIDKINIKNSEDKWYSDFKNNSEDYEVNLDFNKNLGNSLIMFINYKVRDYKDNFLAATGVGIELFNIEEMLNSFKDKYKYDVYFLNTDGEIILFSKKLNKRGNIENIEGLKDIKPEIFLKTINQLEYKNRDGEYLLSTKYIEKLKLYLLVEINKDEYLHDLKKRFYMNLFISILVTFIIVLIIVYAINIYQKQLEDMAGEDTLTKLANRRKFNDFFEKNYSRYQKDIKKLTLILIDIDDFKEINDTFGHLVGDRALVRFSQILKHELRQTDEIARWGGEEFAILLVDVKKEDAIEIAKKLKNSIKEDKKLFDMLNKQMTISLGLGELASEDSQDGLIQKVDNALYEAKNSGKDKLVIV